MTKQRLERGDRDKLDRLAADAVVEAIQRQLARATHAVLGVVGGRSVGGIYSHLQSTDLPWEKIHVFLADERLVPITSDESNFKLVKSDLLSRPLQEGIMPEDNAHPYPFDPNHPDGGIPSYNEQLDRLGGRFDIAILSAGEDGHTASLFPQHPSIENSANGFIVVEESPKPPPRRISASRALLENTPLGLMVFYGEGKREALQKFENQSLGTEDCPSKLVRAMEQSIVLTDL